MLINGTIEHHAITQLVLGVLQLVVLQLEELERFQLLVLSVLLVLQRRIRLCYTRCRMCYSRCRMNCDDRSVMLERNMAGMSRSLVLQLCMHCSLVLVLALLLLLLLFRSMSGMSCHSLFEYHNGGFGDENHNDWWFCILSADSNCFGQLQRCWRAALRPTRTGFQDVALFYPS